MKLHTVGFFRELPHGLPDAPSLAEAIGSNPVADEDLIVRYLKDAVLFVVSPGIVKDILKPSIPIGSPHVLTDGVWAWPADLAYYVANYHVVLPPEFVAHMQQRNWRPPQADDVAIEELQF